MAPALAQHGATSSWRCIVTHLVGQALKLCELFDGPLDGNRIDEIGEAARRFLLDAIEATRGALALQGPDIAEEAGIVEEVRHVLQGKGVLYWAWAARVAHPLSCFVGHCCKCSIITT